MTEPIGAWTWAGIEQEMTAGEKLDNWHFWKPTILKPDGRVLIYDNWAIAEADGGGTFIGIHENHRNFKSYTGWCGGWVGFKNVAGAHPESQHTLVAWPPLTIAASLSCRACPSHGFIQGGRWVKA